MAPPCRFSELQGAWGGVGATALRGRTVAAIDLIATLLYLAAIKVCGDALW